MPRPALVCWGFPAGLCGEVAESGRLARPWLGSSLEAEVRRGWGSPSPVQEVAPGGWEGERPRARCRRRPKHGHVPQSRSLLCAAGARSVL